MSKDTAVFIAVLGACNTVTAASSPLVGAAVMSLVGIAGIIWSHK